MAAIDLSIPEAETGPLAELAGLLEQYEGFRRVVDGLRRGEPVTLDGVWGSSCALVAAALARHAPGLVVVLTAGPEEADALADDLAMFTPAAVERFAARPSGAAERVTHDDIFGDRIRLVKLLRSGEEASLPRFLVASVQSLLQAVPSRAALAEQTRTMRVGDELPIDGLARWLVENGFQHTTAVELPGEFSVRGGLVDIFPPDQYDPVRMEFFGDQIESIRRFEVSSQRSLGAQNALDLTVLDASAKADGHLADYLPPNAWFLLIEPDEVEQQGKQYLERVEEADSHHSVRAVMERVLRFPTASAWPVAPGSFQTTCQLGVESVERFSGDAGRVQRELEAFGAGQEVYLVCHNEAEVRRLREIFGGTPMAQQQKLHFPLGALHNGFRLVRSGLMVLSSSELFHRTDLRRGASRRRLGRVIDSFLELREGDLVVHIAHGIARYRGMKLLEKDRQVEEHLLLEFDGGTKLYVPSSKIGLVQKYVGGSKARPALAKLGGHQWQRQKSRVEEAVNDMAAEMLEVQAARSSRPGIAFPADTDWQREFDASFPYQETPDQLAAIESIKRDMVQPRAMDRLLCGDVGFGKTEVAMRAAFKTVDAGFQVAILVPTTVLAEQHFRTLSQRMAEYPFSIASLSRFGTRKEQGAVVQGLAQGAIDIVVGTHRLAQPDVQFQNLGLVIIDEEQRFGVEIKERLKTLRTTVDVLTMTATPIPRTLHMSLLGLRDISNLETPPADRLAVETRVTRFHPDLIRHAVLRELNRGGQIFFVHNRVHDIENLARRLRQIVPEARLAIGHGQMPEHELEDVMIDFINHKSDILLATTIIESGLDIPNANTIFIDEADRYGLADLHQLRGRVGRYKHRAYCYLLLDPNKHLSTVSAKRLRAIEEFSDMGAGFAIAMRDLEIRGAGNILGTEQSGHIAAVGYELYCQLLEQAVRRLKHMPPAASVEVDIDLPVEAYIPKTYVPDMRLKIDLYRRLGRVATDAELADYRSELLDRFGPPPPVLERLLLVAELRVAAHAWEIGSIHLELPYVVLGYRSAKRVRQLQAASRNRLRVVDDRCAYLPLGEGVAQPGAILAELKSLLQPHP